MQYTLINQLLQNAQQIINQLAAPPIQNQVLPQLIAPALPLNNLFFKTVPQEETKKQRDERFDLFKPC